MILLVNMRRIWRHSHNHLSLQLAGIAGLVATAVVGNAVCFRYFDSTPDNLIAWGDALWYSVISITTIGYGEFYATSLGARLGLILFIVILGLSTFTMLLGIITDQCVTYLEKGRTGMGHSIEQGHMLIVNYPGKQRLHQLLNEIWADDIQHHHRKQRITLISDSIDTCPHVDGPLEFINGSPLEHDSYKRAAAHTANLALILPADYNSSTSDAITASALDVLSHYAPQLNIVAECLDKKRSHLFTNVGENCSVVCGTHIATNLMIQELADPGVAACMEEITSNTVGSTLYTTVVGTATDTQPYIDIAHALLQNGVNLMSISRNDTVHTLFHTHALQAGDVLVYIASERHDWNTLAAYIAAASTATA